MLINFNQLHFLYTPNQKWRSVATKTQISSALNSAQPAAVLQNNQISLGPQIGEGNFGVVHKGSTTLGHGDVAIEY